MQVRFKQAGNKYLRFYPHFINLVMAIQILKQEVFERQIPLGYIISKMNHDTVLTPKISKRRYAQFFNIG